jgi:acetyltransferase-like isoleucine patch superfamily enzyme
VIGFGTVFSHRDVIVYDNVSLGNYCVVGSVQIGAGCEIASRVSITSGKKQHTLTRDGTWSPFILADAKRIEIGKNVWIGEGAVVMADINDGSLIGAGSVVSRDVESGIIVAGNPAVKVGILDKERS